MLRCAGQRFSMTRQTVKAGIERERKRDAKWNGKEHEKLLAPSRQPGRQSDWQLAPGGKSPILGIQTQNSGTTVYPHIIYICVCAMCISLALYMYVCLAVLLLPQGDLKSL